MSPSFLSLTRVAGSYVDKQWRHIRVGDFVELSCDEVIPADILVLSSTDPARICYIETANIDGETSLKQRQVVAAGVLEEDVSSWVSLSLSFLSLLFLSSLSLFMHL